MLFVRSVVLIMCLSVPAVLNAHHSPFLFFDASVTVEMEGTVTRVRWGNPHPKFRVEARQENGEIKVWNIEANSHSILRRMNLSPDVVKVGDKIRAAGWPARRGKNSMFVTNMLAADGVEIIFWPGNPARWSDKTKGDSERWLVKEADIEQPENTDSRIFHVWSTSLADVPSALLFEGQNYPLTETAAAARAAYDMYSNPILESCASKGMPIIMEQPYPMELVDQGDVIVFRMEEGDTVRTIHMGDDVSLEGLPATPLGHSVGHWEGNTLVVTTRGSNWPYFDNTGIPQSPAAQYVERFTPSADGKRLDYSMTITDSATFTEPVTVNKHWLWIPDEEVKPYQCEEQL